MRNLFLFYDTICFVIYDDGGTLACTCILVRLLLNDPKQYRGNQ